MEHEEARKEIDDSLVLSTFCMARLGFSFEKKKTASAYLRQQLMFLLAFCTIVYHVFSEIVYIGLILANSPRVEDFVPLFHTCGYGVLSISKAFVLWYKRDIFRRLFDELAGIWPVPPLDEEIQAIKSKSLSALRTATRWYFTTNILGVWFYNVTPMAVYFYRLLWQKLEDVKIGYIWVSWYPFDKTKPIFHALVYIFETFAGQTCVWIMVGTDLLFVAMASHICLLLRLLQKRLETLGTVNRSDEEYYQEIVANVKLHQRYCFDLEDAFSVANLINIVLSSVNICCVVFTIVLLEPLMAVSNKLFLASALLQMGVICWYGDDILHATADIAVSVYNCKWYRISPKCRKSLLFLLARSQKQVGFTAMKFMNISLVTYSSIISRSYSYFALLYTMYKE